MNTLYNEINEVEVYVCADEVLTKDEALSLIDEYLGGTCGDLSLDLDYLASLRTLQGEL